MNPANLFPYVRRATSCLVITLSISVAFLSAAELLGTEVVLQNDSVPSPGAGTPLLSFVPNEMAAAWLTTPVAGDLVGVQILWDSQFGGNPQSLELGIHIFAGGTFPTPGALLATVVGPLLSDTTVNEFRHLDPPTNAVPLQIPVTAGQALVVALEFLNQSSGNMFASGVEHDLDGCQAGKNAAFAIPGGWIDACGAGVTGDWAIRAIVKPVPEPGTAILLLMGALAWPWQRK
jgi:hypothetical protein